MGQMRFYAPTPEKLLPHAVELAYLAGLEAIPWRSCNHFSDTVLTLERSISESGNLYIPWDIPGIGQRVLSTCTLMEREQPYDLATELARGTLHRVRTLVADMEAQGQVVSQDIRARLREATSALIRATTSSSTAADDAEQTILIASEAIRELTQSQVATLLCEQAATKGVLPSILVSQLNATPLSQGATDDFLAAFHAVNIPFRWREIQPSEGPRQWSSVERQLQWSRDQGLRIIGGPLIQLDPLSLPDGVYTWQDDYETFEENAIRHIQAVVGRFDAVVDLWVCAGRLNVPGALDFSEEQRLRLAVASIEAVRHAAPRTPVVISFDQPWAEYLSTQDFDLSPLHFADALVRAELGVAGVALEMNWGYWPAGTLPRDLLAVSRHLDRWSLLGIPLLVYLTMPSQFQDDPQAVGPAAVVPHSPSHPRTAAIGQDQASQLIPLLLSKPALHGIIWNQLTDAEPHEFPCSGLFDASSQAKPLLPLLAEIRSKYLS